MRDNHGHVVFETTDERDAQNHGQGRDPGEPGWDTRLGDSLARRLLWMALVPLAFLPACERKDTPQTKVIVIGMDGLDPRLCERLMDRGELPHFAALRRQGGYSPLATTIPPQSPVAWSTFISGANPGVHGIFDFIHRDPDLQFAPYYAAARTIQSAEGWEVGRHRIPLTFWPFNHEAGRTVLLRDGAPFWDYLDGAGVPVRIYDIPANYPPSRSAHGHVCCLSGMGVPDLLGTYGTYQFFSEETFMAHAESGGMRKPLFFTDNQATAVLTGPSNSLLKTPADVDVTFRILRDPEQASARIDLQGRHILLRQGEWSDWREVLFKLEMPPFLPDVKVRGIVRFYLQQVRPNFRLYVTPINIDPADPGRQRLSEPPDFIHKIAGELGPFYTTGFKEDHKALSNGIFSDEEYRVQAEQVLTEKRHLLTFARQHYENGLLFFYFSSTDLQAHMFWWDGDDKHPLRSQADARKYEGVIEELYRQMDEVVGELLDQYGSDATLLVMSDHGFCNFRRQFNLNAWLRQEGYIQPADCRSLQVDVDWGRTTAYGLGLNGLYLNLAGRERDGIVSAEKRDQLLDEITAKLLALRDPQDGHAVIARVDRADQVYRGPHVDRAPDVVIGYHRGYRASWATTLGEMGDAVLSDNDSAWSADHCIAADQVPGVIFSNRRIVRSSPSLLDLAPTILAEFGIAAPEQFEGGNLFETELARSPIGPGR